MKYILIMSLILPVVSQAGDLWKYQTSAIVLLEIDRRQTHEILRSDQHKEANPLINKSNVNYYFGAAMIGVYGVKYLPKSFQKPVLTFINVFQGSYVAGNYSAGVRFKMRI